MPPVGPQLPIVAPEKRKRETETDDESDESDDATGPQPPPSDETASKKPRVIGPTLPPRISAETRTSEADLRDTNHISGDDNDNDDDDSDSDSDDFGPSLPSAQERVDASRQNASSAFQTTGADAPATAAKRDDWMTIAPTNGDWSSRIDPTKLKNRKFNTGKGAKGPSSTGNATSTWHETPAEKQARLRREMMGIKQDSARPDMSGDGNADRITAETAQRMAEYNKSRGPSLYQSRQSQHSEKDDDPSARAFDREKDVGGGLQINATKRKELLKKASDFSTRFGSAKYL